MTTLPSLTPSRPRVAWNSTQVGLFPVFVLCAGPNRHEDAEGPSLQVPVDRAGPNRAFRAHSIDRFEPADRDFHAGVQLPD
jgi:hypothetical protein